MSLQISKGGRLIECEWHYDDVAELGEYRTQDVTDSAIRRMWGTECTLEDGLTIRDIFLLLNTQLDLFDAVLGNWCREHVTLGLQTEEGAPKETEIEYLELSWTLEHEREEGKKSRKIQGLLFPEFHGIGFFLNKDEVDDYGNVIGKAGTRTTYAISLTPANELARLPVRLRPELEIRDRDDWKNPGPSLKFDACEYSLGHILYGIIWEISFHGKPESRTAQLDELNRIVSEFKAEKGR